MVRRAGHVLPEPNANPKLTHYPEIGVTLIKSRTLPWLLGFLTLVALWPLGCVSSSAAAAEVGHGDGTTSCVSALFIPLPWAGQGDGAFIVAIVGALLTFVLVRWLLLPRRSRRVG